MTPEPTPPWSIADVRTACLPALFGTVVLGWSWWQASGTGVLDEQTTAVVFGVLGAGVAGAGCLSWIAAGRRAVRLRRLELLELLEQGDLVGVGTAADTGIRRLVAVPGTTRYHRPDCLLVRGKDVARVASVGASTSGLTACEMCRP